MGTDNNTVYGRVYQHYFIKIGALVLFFVFLCVNNHEGLHAQSFDIAVNNKGISFGNSKNFTGLRINIVDNEVEEIKGVNITIFKAHNIEDARMKGISIGIISPEAGYLNGIQIGGIGVRAEKKLNGISIGMLGAGSNGDISGITIGGLGAGAGDSITGITIGGLGAGAGNDLKGVAFGLLGAGAGNRITGLVIGGLGAGCGNDLKGITIGGLGAGAGNSATGLVIGGLGAGCGNNLKGIAIGGLGAGAGNNLKGLAFGLLGVGAGSSITGAAIALGTVQLEEGGTLTGFTASAYNKIEGMQKGLSIGLLNYAHDLNGIQVGIINYVRNNPIFFKLLPLINFNFD